MLGYSTQTTDFQLQYVPLNQQPHAAIPKEQFTAKLAFSKQRFADLDFFRQQIEKSKAGLHHQPYTTYRRTVLLYKTVFFSFAFLFGILGFTSLAIPSAIACGFFSMCTAVKGVLASLCMVFSLTAFTMAFSMSSEKEAVAQYIRKTRATLLTIYRRKQIRLGIKPFFGFFTHSHQAATLRQMYYEAIDQVNDKKEASLHLMHRIGTAKTLDRKEKEDLLNQAIEELNEKLRALVHTFRHAHVEI